MFAGISHGASVNVTLLVAGPGGLMTNTAVAVPDSCSVEDSAGVAHVFGGNSSVCALRVAAEGGLISGFEITDWGFGFSLDSIGGVSNEPDWSEFWIIWKNGTLSDLGIDLTTLANGDELSLEFGPWPGDGAVVETGGGPVVAGPLPATFNQEQAALFLVLNQNEDGSFGSLPFLSDWVAIAFGAYEGQSASVANAKNALAGFLKEDATLDSLTDYERRAMALLALGMDPRNEGPVDVIAKIEEQFDGVQFGSPSAANDDIFALFSLLKSGYAREDEMIKKSFEFVRSFQAEDGSFGGVDMTAAVIQAFALAGMEDESVSRARAYLLSREVRPGDFGNAYSSSWALQALSALNDRADASWLASLQEQDGGLAEETLDNRVWITAYALPAVLGKAWGDILITALPAAVSFETDEGMGLSKGEGDGVSAPLTLEEIQFRVDAVAFEVEALKPQVALLRAEYLARLEAQSLAAGGEKKQVQEYVATATAAEPSLDFQDVSPSTVRFDEASFSADVAGAVSPRFFQSPGGLIAMAVGLGMLIFLILGKGRFTFAAFLRRAA
ncbi:MAG: DUF4430 domain-containing protein [Candidatus Wildermuthbacteria bacterium]|nr:DUF4430 domain-containing protein [Candidatus Wildermuthbacteria bacterium]